MKGLAAAAALALLIPIPARADGPADPRIHWETPVLQPRVTGVTVEIAPPVTPHTGPLITVRTRTPFELMVLGPQGEPFLRIGRDRSFGNVRSPYFGPAMNPSRPAAPSPGGPDPLWKPVSAAVGTRWYERRAAYAGHAPPNAGESSLLQTWRVDALVRGSPVQLTGEIRWRPVRGRIEPSVSRIAPSDPSIEVRALPGPIPAIQLRNGSGRTIEITGRDGKPFARIGVDGVEINVNSATYRDTRSLPPAASASVKFERQQQSVLVWLERRAAYEAEIPEKVQAAGKRVRLREWTVPGTIGGSPFEIVGATEWIPIGSLPSGTASEDGFPLWTVLGSIAGAGLVLAAVPLLLKRLRDRP